MLGEERPSVSISRGAHGAGRSVEENAINEAPVVDSLKRIGTLATFFHLRFKR